MTDTSNHVTINMMCMGKITKHWCVWAPPGSKTKSYKVFLSAIEFSYLSQSWGGGGVQARNQALSPSLPLPTRIICYVQHACAGNKNGETIKKSVISYMYIK